MWTVIDIGECKFFLSFFKNSFQAICMEGDAGMQAKGWNFPIVVRADWNCLNGFHFHISALWIFFRATISHSHKHLSFIGLWLQLMSSAITSIIWLRVTQFVELVNNLTLANFSAKVMWETKLGTNICFRNVFRLKQRVRERCPFGLFWSFVSVI